MSISLAKNPTAKLHLAIASLCLAITGAVVAVLACGGAAPEAPAAPAGTAQSGACAKDTDCKGERVCVNGSCVNPR